MRRALHCISVRKNFGVWTWTSFQRIHSVGHTFTDGEAEVKCHVESQSARLWVVAVHFHSHFCLVTQRLPLPRVSGWGVGLDPLSECGVTERPLVRPLTGSSFSVPLYYKVFVLLIIHAVKLLWDTVLAYIRMKSIRIYLKLVSRS